MTLNEAATNVWAGAFGAAFVAARLRDDTIDQATADATKLANEAVEMARKVLLAGRGSI